MIKHPTLHKILGDHEWKRKGLREYCKICGVERNKVWSPRVFNSGDIISANPINENFEVLAEAIKEVDSRLKEVEIWQGKAKRKETCQKEEKEN